MSHIEFNEAFMGMTKGGALPGTSRKGRALRKDPAKVTKKRVPGVSPCILKVVRVNNYMHHVRLRDGDKLIATVTKGKGRGANQGYSYRLVGDIKPHHGFKSLQEVVVRVATKL